MIKVHNENFIIVRDVLDQLNIDLKDHVLFNDASIFRRFFSKDRTRYKSECFATLKRAYGDIPEITLCKKYHHLSTKLEKMLTKKFGSDQAFIILLKEEDSFVTQYSF